MISGGLSLGDQAQQLGGNNSADITIRSANGGAVYLYQNNPGATVQATRDHHLDEWRRPRGAARLRQPGDATVKSLDVAPLTVDGQAIDGAIVQNGSGNRGTVTSGNGAGILVQNGSGNSAGLDTTLSAPGSSIVYTQNGSNLQALTNAQVMTNALGTTTVTQTGFGGITSRGAASVTVTQTNR